MTMSIEQRRQINRQNAAKSTGPKTDEGKARSRRNALTHGLRAEALDLPNEAPGAFEALATEWHDYYRPASPGERALVDRAVYATIQLRRCAVFQAEAVGKRVREAAVNWDRRQADDLAALDRHFWGDDPALALNGLKQMAAGCALLLDDWAALLDALDTHGRWEAIDRDKALRLCAQHPDSNESTPLSYLVRYYNLFILADPNPEAVAHLLDPQRIPPCLLGTFGPTRPTPDESRAALRALIENETDAIRDQHATMDELDSADRAGASSRALLLDGPEGALLLRYERMHDSAFHRAYAALLKGHKDASKTADPSAAPNEPNSPADPDPAAVAPRAAAPEPVPVAVEPEAEPPATGFAPNEAKLNALMDAIETVGEAGGDTSALFARFDALYWGIAPPVPVGLDR